jgi:hypothetical protein
MMVARRLVEVSMWNATKAYTEAVRNRVKGKGRFEKYFRRSGG